MRIKNLWTYKEQINRSSYPALDDHKTYHKLKGKKFWYVGIQNKDSIPIFELFDKY